MSITRHNYDSNFIGSYREAPNRPENYSGTIGYPYGEKYFYIKFYHVGAKYFSSCRIVVPLASDIFHLPEAFAMPFQKMLHNFFRENIQGENKLLSSKKNPKRYIKFMSTSEITRLR